MLDYQKLALLCLSLSTLSACVNIKDQNSSGSKPASYHVPITATKLVDIPSGCKDPSKNFRPVRSILSRGSYNSDAKPYQPINNTKGFFNKDFNQDGKADYHFIEASKARNIRLISCLSKTNGFNRRVTPFIVHETIKADFQTISESIQVKGNTLILSINKHEHNWGSDSQINTYRYSKKHHEFLLEQQEITSSSGDGLRSDTYEFYDLQALRYKTKSTCGSLEEGCQPRNKNGTLVLPQKRATLLNTNKAYSRLL